ncbi:MAG: tetratricopeptide repeat protein [Polyangiaceae bacterium]|jgi:hypothetical protein|nr:tetratricopeptide repeat protein [Polyangiaceae bacterium]
MRRGHWLLWGCLLVFSAACGDKGKAEGGDGSDEKGGKKRRDKSDKQELTDPSVKPPSPPTATPTGTPVGGTQEDADFERWSQKAKGSPPDPDAAYNAGQYLYNRKRFEEALAMWRVAKAATPDDFDAAKKIVQALNALGRHDEAARELGEVRRIFQTSTDERVKKQSNVVIDQLVVAGRAVMVLEMLVPNDPTLHYHWTARVDDGSGKKVAFTVQLESSAYGRESGMPFLTGVTRPAGHASFEGYKALPPYGEWRATATKRIEAELGK